METGGFSFWRAGTHDCVKMMWDIRDKMDAETAGRGERNILRIFVEK
ncbi:MAG: hypothetical protein LBT94_02835 [Prevotellaceae bacterium]|nr:hypothetical protein [Prevotellaceae bacterium]